MICPNCGHDNLPGSEECSSCQQDLTQLDRPVATNRVERSLMDDHVGSLGGTRQPVCVAATSSVQDALLAMLGPTVGALLVVDAAGKLIGILSERDLLHKVAGHAKPLSQLQVVDFMTHDPETVCPTDSLAFALHKMDVGGYRHLPVVTNRQDKIPLGVLSVRDLLRHIVKLCKDG